jgi:peptide maturation system protein (TIGR04066 family)
MRIKVAFYPFCAELLPVVKTFEKLQNYYTISRLISPRGFGLTGHDAGYACNHSDTGIIVTDEFDYNHAEWTTLILFEPIMVKEKIEYPFEMIAEQAIQSGKYVIFLSISTKVNDQMKKIFDQYPNQIEFRTCLEWNSKRLVERSYNFHEAEVPIVLVGGIIEEADVLEVLLKLAVKMKEEGVNALIFTKHPIGGLMDFHNMNYIWDATNWTESQKINELNHYINNMVDSLRPDVVLMEAADAVMRYNDKAPNGFGIRTFMICQAVTPDRFICCVPFGFAVGEFISAISLGLKKSLGSPVAAVHVSNVLMDQQEINQRRDIMIVRSNRNHVRNQLMKEGENSRIPMYDVVTDGIDSLYNDLFHDET